MEFSSTYRVRVNVVSVTVATEQITQIEHSSIRGIGLELACN